MPTVDHAVEHKVPVLENAIVNVKTHIKKYQAVYSFGAGAVLMGTILVLTKQNGPVVHIAPVFNNIGPQVNFGGHMTKMVKRLEDGKIWEQVTDAAKESGASLSLMSRHLNGHKPDVYGLHYQIIGMGTT